MKGFAFASPESRFPERRYVAFKRPDGFYSCREEYWYRNLDDDGVLIAEGWAQLPAGSLFASAKDCEQHILALLS